MKPFTQMDNKKRIEVIMNHLERKVRIILYFTLLRLMGNLRLANILHSQVA